MKRSLFFLCVGAPLSVREKDFAQNPPQVFQVAGGHHFSQPVSVNKTEYAYGEEFDLSSIEVVKKFASGKADEKVATTSADFAISGYDANTPGEQTVTITYAGQTYTVKVTVAEKQGCGSAISPVGGIAIGATVLVAALAAVLIKRKSCR